MEERAVAGPSGDLIWVNRSRKRRMALAVGNRRFPILSLDHESCLVEAPMEAAFRGCAEIFEDGRLTAVCLIQLCAAEGTARRIQFKQYTSARNEAPRDFAD